MKHDNNFLPGPAISTLMPDVYGIFQDCTSKEKDPELRMSMFTLLGKLYSIYYIVYTLHTYIHYTAYIDYGGCDYGECDYGGCDYGECEYGGCEYSE